jgi:hypothetical protein
VVDGELVAQSEDFDLQRQSGADDGSQTRHYSQHHGLHGRLPYRCQRADSIPFPSPVMSVEITRAISG